MDTKQKLTLGIAAIFMVTLTIVGVTYAYFVTRVDTQGEASVDVKTANVGSVEYQAGNGSSDVVTLDDKLPGTVLYKSFKVHNTSTDETINSAYNIFLTSTTTASTPQFVHASSTTDCYKSTALQSTEEGATCFDATTYNNVKVTLYEVDEAVFETVQDDGTITNADALVDADEAALPNTILTETGVAAKAGVEAGTATQDLATNLTIVGNDTKFYVLKVEYEDTGSNQNIENDAALSIKVSIK